MADRVGCGLCTRKRLSAISTHPAAHVALGFPATVWLRWYDRDNEHAFPQRSPAHEVRIAGGRGAATTHARETLIVQTGLELTVLGDLSVNGLPPETAARLISQPKRLSVLLYLALSLPRGPKRRDELLPVFWADAPRARGLASLRKTIHHLRQSLPEGVFEIRDSGEIGLAFGLTRCDAVAFETALDAGDEEGALALFGGPLLPGLRVPDAPDFERWLDGERLRLNRRAARAAWFLAERAADEGADGSTVTRAVLRGVQFGPYDEVAIRGGLRSLFRVGNRAAAADVFESLRQRLALEFDMVPSPETVELFQALVSGTDRDGRPPTDPGRGAPVLPGSAADGDSLPAIAILPLTDLSPEPAGEWFADGLTEEIIHRVTELGIARVVSRLSSFAFKGVDKDVREIGNALGADLVLEGSIRRANGRVRITVQLIDATSGHHRWSHEAEATDTDLLSVQDAIAKEVADRIANVRGSRAVDPASRPALADEGGRGSDAEVSHEAYTEYLKGRFQLARRTPDSIRSSIEHAGRATELAPDFAPAHALLALAYFILKVYTPDLDAKVAFELSQASARRALRLDERLSEAHFAMACFYAAYERQWSEADAAFERALELDPGNAACRAVYALYPLTVTGRHEEALSQVLRAVEDDPLALPTNAYVGMVNHFAHRFDEAIEAARKTVHLDDTYTLGHWVLGLAAEAAGESVMALEAFTRARELTRDSELMRAQVANALARSGEELAAETLLSTLVRRDDQGEETGHVVPFICAGAYAALGRTETALDLLYQAYRERETHVIYANVDPRFESLRKEPRFRQLVIRMGLSPTVD